MTRTSKLWAGTIAALALLAALVLVYTFGIPKQVPQAGTKIYVRLKWIHQAQFAGFYYAKEAGYYEAEGLDVTLNAGGVDFPAIQIVSSGSEQFGVAGADQVLLAIAKGVPIVAVAVIYQKNPVVLMAMSDSGITKPADFVGKRIGVKLGASADVSYQGLMKRQGISRKLVTEIPVKYDMTPLFTGQVDVWPGYVINEPILARAQGKDLTLIWAADYGADLYGDVIFTSEEMVRHQPEVVQRFIRATLKGWEHALRNRQQAVQYILKYGDQLQEQTEAAKLDASVSIIAPGRDPIGWMTAERWKDTERALLEVGFLDEPLALEKVYTERFVTKAYGR